MDRDDPPKRVYGSQYDGRPRPAHSSISRENRGQIGGLSFGPAGKTRTGSSTVTIESRHGLGRYKGAGS